MGGQLLQARVPLGKVLVKVLVQVLVQALGVAVPSVGMRVLWELLADCWYFLDCLSSP